MLTIATNDMQRCCDYRFGTRSNRSLLTPCSLCQLQTIRLAFKLLRFGTMKGTYGEVVSLAEVTQVRVAVTNRRSEVRRRPSEVRWLRGARLKYGPDVEIVDISRNGILIRSPREFSPNERAVLELCATTGRFLVIASVLRSRQVTASHSAWYETAFRFKHPLETEKYSSPVRT